ncbi:MAG: NAD(P)H-binding protein [Parvibaculum sp.]|nr:NAD(P)H-binding protein [Parvibaculum sp.]|tara:strand:- start:1396 stop:2070 length:675 start_codon:yes stop_codon:yes gene_type:complete
MTEKRTALVAGASGLVGGSLIRQLLASPTYTKVIAITRRELDIDDPKLRQIVIPLDDMESFLTEAIVRADDAFCALGTTIKVAGSQAAFRKVDHDYVVAFARAAKAAGAARFMLVTAIGASSASKIFYSRVKGEAEEAVAAVGFEALHIFRPGLLLGARGERRAAESLMMKLSPLLNPLMLGAATVYRSINAEVVAAAMVAAAGGEARGRQVHTYAEMVKLAGV